ncbi:MAG: dihydroorotate dehydrogenase electron transfer subunit, partial [Chloroflexi bacterium]|nr:dihydroorotate dehydrogenase electron transfer subunit [Chloroflexota bacterium]
SAGEKGLVTDLMAPLLRQSKVDSVFACGPGPMLEAVAALARKHRIPAQLSWEAYMRCGLGLCGSCEHEGRLLCQEGPVLATP